MRKVWFKWGYKLCDKWVRGSSFLYEEKSEQLANNTGSQHALKSISIVAVFA